MRARGFSAAAATALLAALSACRPAAEPPPQQTLSITELLAQADPAGFARALAPRPIQFPADHGPHPEFRSEWWYFTGNLATESGRRFGYQLTFFRNALTADPRPRGSIWAASQVYMAHLALSDPGGGRFVSHERFARGAAGLAGAGTAPFRVWLEDWSVEGGESLPPIRLRAAAGAVGLELDLGPGKPPVLQGEDGLSRKGVEPGNASYYYSLTRLPTTGRVLLDGEPLALRGLSWMDREWSTSALAEGVAGWDWFSLQLDDGRDLMFYRLRRVDGSTDPLSAGSLVEADGSWRRLGAGDVGLEELVTWRSPGSGRRYPAAWRLGLPGDGLELEVEPLLADQELRHSFVYWEGAVRCRGARGGRPVSGYGYVELTGYE